MDFTLWQTYWTGVPIGVEGEGLKNAKILEDPSKLSVENVKFAQPWADKLNQHYGLGTEASEDEGKSRKLFKTKELDLLRAIYAKKIDDDRQRKFSVNIGSWWGYIFDTARINLGAVKNARTWQLPTVFSTRSNPSPENAKLSPLWLKGYEPSIASIKQLRGGFMEAIDGNCCILICKGESGTNKPYALSVLHSPEFKPDGKYDPELCGKMQKASPAWVCDKRKYQVVTVFGANTNPRKKYVEKLIADPNTIQIFPIQ